MGKTSKLETRMKRHRSIRKRVEGSPERPRLCVFRSARHIYAQIIDDVGNRTLLAVSDVQARATEGKDKPAKKERARQVGLSLAQKCLEKGIDKVVFDRGGYKYHGRVSELAAGAREGGLKF